MKFNSLKFELIRYGKNNQLKESTTYVTPEWELIDEKDDVRDLGVTLSNCCNFKQHIANIVESAKRMSSWVLRTFATREKIPMMTLFKTLVRPLLEYSSPLWSPTAKGDIQKLEEVQKSFIKKIRGTSRNYQEALKQLNLYSLEQRRTRYMSIQVWKILENITPNTGETEATRLQPQTTFSHRRGRTCPTFNLNNTPSHLLQARKQTLRCQGAKIFNSLPKQIRNITHTTVDVFKSNLDKYLRSSMESPYTRFAHASWQETNHPHPIPSIPHHHNQVGILTEEHDTAVPLIFPVSEAIAQRPARGRTVVGQFTLTS